MNYKNALKASASRCAKVAIQDASGVSFLSWLKPRGRLEKVKNDQNPVIEGFDRYYYFL
ncbi:hypothetical protein ACVV62_02940 [Streptococcus pluranimalium]